MLQRRSSPKETASSSDMPPDSEKAYQCCPSERGCGDERKAVICRRTGTSDRTPCACLFNQTYKCRVALLFIGEPNNIRKRSYAIIM